ncbi:MAG: DMT family transporter [Pseudomonadota bacterium]
MNPLGFVAALVSAIAFALNVTFAAVAYDHGADVHAVNLVRPWFFLLCMAGGLWVSGVHLRLPASSRNLALGLGVLMTLEMYALLAAIQYVPVSIAILTFFLYPLLIAGAAFVLGRERFSPIRVLAMLVTFAGLALALDAAADSIDWTGVALAFAAAVAIATIVYVSERELHTHDSRAVLLWMMVSSSAIVVVINATLATPTFPDTQTGWAAFAVSTALYALATFLLFKAVALIGPVRTSVVDNSSPVWALFAGVLILDESMTSPQVAGTVLVVAGIITVNLAETLERRRS